MTQTISSIYDSNQNIHSKGTLIPQNYKSVIPYNFTNSYPECGCSGTLNSPSTDKDSLAERMISLVPPFMSTIERIVDRLINHLDQVRNSELLERILFADKNIPKGTVEQDISSPISSSEVAESSSTSNSASNLSRASKSLEKTGEFLWKPKADKDGKLVILLPRNFTGEVKEVVIYDTKNKKELAKGKYSNIGNGDREHYRFTKAGSAFPDNSTVIIKLNNGGERKIKISDTAKRFTY